MFPAVLLILIITETMYGQSGNTSKLVAYDDGFTEAGILSETRVLWDTTCDLGPKLDTTHELLNLGLLLKNRIKRAFGWF